MTLQEVAKTLGIEEYPEEMDRYFPVSQDRKGEMPTDELIDRLQEKYDLFGPFVKKMHQGLQDMENDLERKIWMETVSQYLKDCSLKEAKKIPFPPMGSSPASKLLPMLSHLPSIEDTYRGYRSRGFSHEQTITNMEGYKVNMAIVAAQTDGFPGIHGILCPWICNYTKGVMVRHGCLNFEMRNLPKDTPYILKHKVTGEVLPVSTCLPVHRSGLMLGSAGAEEKEGSFEATWEETEEEYIGYPVKNFRFSNQKEHFSKKDWSLLASPKDPCISVHIPKKVDLSPETVARTLAEAKELLPRMYPEHAPRLFHTGTWLLCPDLEEVLKPESKILAFARFFVRFPKIDEGMSVFNWVFPNDCGGDYEKLPEDNSLRRGLKKKYLKGEYILKFAGVIPL